MAVNCCVVPSGMDALAGVTAMETRAAAVTVSAGVLLLVTAPSTALIVVGPVPTLVARPAALMVAMEVADEVQVALLVRFCVLPSV